MGHRVLCTKCSDRREEKHSRDQKSELLIEVLGPVDTQEIEPSGNHRSKEKAFGSEEDPEPEAIGLKRVFGSSES